MSPAASTRKRLDQALFDQKLTESREQAKRLIMAGKVKINDQRARKPSDSVQPDDRLEVQEPEKFVSRGGFKLEKALDDFSINVEGKIAVDLGASTGGSQIACCSGALSACTRWTWARGSLLGICAATIAGW